MNPVRRRISRATCTRNGKNPVPGAGARDVPGVTVWESDDARADYYRRD